MRIVRCVEISTTLEDGVEQVRNVNERGILTFLTGVFVGEKRKILMKTSGNQECPLS